MNNSTGTITQLLSEWGNDNKDAFHQIFPLTYHRLRKSAKSALNRFNNNHSIQGTELVNELYLSFHRQKNVKIKSSEHFYAIAHLKLMQILTDIYRRNKAQRNDVNHLKNHNNSPSSTGTDAHFYDLLTCRALEKLETEDPEAAQIAQHMILHGFNKRQTRETLQVSERKFKIKWDFAKERLTNYLEI